MNRTYRHSIYGSRKTTNTALAQCCKQMNDIIRSVTGMMYTVMNTVDAYFPETFVMNQIIGQMRGLARLSPKLFVRVTWRQRYPNVYFDDRNVLHRLQIKGIYLEFNGDYCDDPLFKDALGTSLITESKMGRSAPKGTTATASTATPATAPSTTKAVAPMSQTRAPPPTAPKQTLTTTQTRAPMTQSSPVKPTLPPQTTQKLTTPPNNPAT